MAKCYFCGEVAVGSRRGARWFCADCVEERCRDCGAEMTVEEAIHNRISGWNGWSVDGSFCSKCYRQRLKSSDDFALAQHEQARQELLRYHRNQRLWQTCSCGRINDRRDESGRVIGPDCSACYGKQQAAAHHSRHQGFRATWRREGK